MKKRLLLDGITLHSAHVSPRNVELSAVVVADLANSGLSFRNWTTMAAGIAAEAIALNGFVQFAFADILIQDFAERRQQKNLFSILN